MKTIRTPVYITHHPRPPTINKIKQQARQAQEHGMYELVQPYEEKASLDEVPDPGSGFRLIEK